VGVRRPRPSSHPKLSPTQRVACLTLGSSFAFSSPGPASNDFIGEPTALLRRFHRAGPFCTRGGASSHERAGADGFAVVNSQYVAWFSSWVFAVASSTIPSGSMSERTCLEGYILLSAFVHSWVYPVFYHWVFHGWLSRSFGGASYVGFMDFSGSAYVHSVGGAVALTGSILLGARLGRFDSGGRPVYRGFKPYSYSLIGLGCLLLWTGWYGAPFSLCSFVTLCQVRVQLAWPQHSNAPDCQ
jgi:ammonia channel protein AmtB